MRIVSPQPENPPVTIEFTAEEAMKLKTIIGRIGGTGPLKEFSNTLFNLLNKYDHYKNDKYIYTSMKVKD